MFRYVMVVLCTTILYGCVSYPPDYPTKTERIIDHDIITSIKPGKTTKNEVETLLGKPLSVFTYEVLEGAEEEEWSYSHVDIPVMAPVLVGVGIGVLTGVPIVGQAATIVAGKMMDSDNVFYLLIRFSKQDIVKQIEKCKAKLTFPRQKCEN